MREIDETMLQNIKKRFENLKKLASKNNGYIEPTLYDVEIDEILIALNIAINTLKKVGAKNE